MAAERQKKMKTRRQKLADIYAEQNRACAAIILANSSKYGGDGSLMVEWAKAVLQRDGQERPALGFRCAA